MYDTDEPPDAGKGLGPLNVVDLDYSLYDDKRLYKDDKGGKMHRKNGFVRALPVPFSRLQEKQNRDSLLWVAYASQPQKVSRENNQCPEMMCDCRCGVDLLMGSRSWMTRPLRRKCVTSTSLVLIGRMPC